MKRVNVGDIEIAVQDVGSGRPILFVHGFPLSHAMWEAQVETFSESHRFRNRWA